AQHRGAPIEYPDHLQGHNSSGSIVAHLYGDRLEGTILVVDAAEREGAVGAAARIGVDDIAVHHGVARVIAKSVPHLTIRAKTDGARMKRELGGVEIVVIHH